MPKHNFMISRAVDLVARKLAGMDAETVARLTQVLSEEAQMISDELQNTGENVSSDILAARLDGLVARMKYEVRNQGPDPSPHEFPIFNVSHNPESPYPNPINHLYDKRYKEAYSTFIKQNQAASSTPPKNEPSTPTTPITPQPTINPNPNPPPYPTYPQGQYQQQSNKQQPPPPFRQQPTVGWQYANPYATMPRSHAAYYQQQAAKVAPPPTQGQPPVRRSSTGEEIRSNSLSRSASSNELNYSTNPGAEKIRVRVINDNSGTSTTDPQTNMYQSNRPYAQRSILKSNPNSNDNNGTGTTRTIYAAPNTTIGNETIQDLFKVVEKQGSDPTRSTASPMTERVIIIDRRDPNSSDNNSNASGVDRYRTFEIRTSTAGATPSTPPITSTAIPTTPTPTNSTSSAAYAMQQPNYFPGQQFFYQQPRIYSSVPNNLYTATPYGVNANNFYTFGYYHY